MPEANSVIGDHRMQAAGDVELSSTGGVASIAANGLDGKLMLSGTKMACQQCGSGMLTMENNAPGATDISLQTGPLGSILMGLGPMLIGARMKMTTSEIEIAVGPPELGSSIKMTPASIKLSVAGNTFELTPLGLTETIAQVTTRSATPAGHEMKSAESSYALNPMGEATNAPTSAIKAMTMGESEAGAMSTAKSSGPGTIQGAVVMIN
jgi:hypothetical protein